MFCHILDLSVVNAWLLYLKKFPQKANTAVQFGKELSYYLIKSGLSTSPSCGRSSQPALAKTTKSKGRPVVRPLHKLINDNHKHMPLYEIKRNLCKMANCKMFSFIRCEKCNVY